MRLIFEWDENKARVNRAKHGTSFSEAKTVFNDPFLLTFPDELHSEAEWRSISLGLSAANRVLLVIHTERGRTEQELVIRIISCRKATASERRTYEENQS